MMDVEKPMNANLQKPNKKGEFSLKMKNIKKLTAVLSKRGVRAPPSPWPCIPEW